VLAYRIDMIERLITHWPVESILLLSGSASTGKSVALNLSGTESNAARKHERGKVATCFILSMVGKNAILNLSENTTQSQIKKQQQL